MAMKLKRLFHCNFMRITVMGQLPSESVPASGFKHCVSATV